MTKKISTTIGILIVVLVAGVVGSSVLFFNQVVEQETIFREDNEKEKQTEEERWGWEEEDEHDKGKDMSINEDEDEKEEFNDSVPEKEAVGLEDKINKMEKEEIKEVVKYFMEEVYIKGNYEKASALYVPPEGFETSSRGYQGEGSLEEYIGWYAHTVSGLLKNVTHVEVIDIKKCIIVAICDLDYCYEEEICREDDVLYVSFSFIKENGESVLWGPCCGAEGQPSALFSTKIIKKEGDYKIYEELPYIP